MMIQHLRQVVHPAASMFDQVQQERIEMEWQTIHNSHDSGIFMMRHMETYMGELKKWNTGFSAEGKDQDGQIKTLKKKYVTKIITHYQNTINREILEEVDTYHLIDAAIRATILRNSKDSRHERLEM